MKKACAAVFFGIVAASAAHASAVALTFDDLPVFGAYTTVAQGKAITDKLVSGLKRHHFVVTGFVNEIQLDRGERTVRTGWLEKWLDAGMDLGNHSYSHLSLDNTPVDDYIADVAKGDNVTSKLLAAKGRTERWYRYPYLETGPTLAIKSKFEAWLGAHGYRIAPVTMENSDWQFDPAYSDAVARKDSRAARHYQKEYLAYTAAAVAWYREASVALLGREIDFVFLLHASRLNADSVGQLAHILSDNHLDVIPLDEAMKDPAYQRPDDYVGPDGNEWLERWSQSMHRGLPYEKFPKVPEDIIAAANRLDPDKPRTPPK